MTPNGNYTTSPTPTPIPSALGRTYELTSNQGMCIGHGWMSLPKPRVRTGKGRRKRLERRFGYVATRPPLLQALGKSLGTYNFHLFYCRTSSNAVVDSAPWKTPGRDGDDPHARNLLRVNLTQRAQGCTFRRPLCEAHSFLWLEAKRLGQPRKAGKWWHRLELLDSVTATGDGPPANDLGDYYALRNGSGPLTKFHAQPVTAQNILASGFCFGMAQRFPHFR